MEKQGVAPIDVAKIREFYRDISKNVLAALATAAPLTEQLLDQEREAIAVFLEEKALARYNEMLPENGRRSLQTVAELRELDPASVEVKLLLNVADEIRNRK